MCFWVKLPNTSYLLSIKPRIGVSWGAGWWFQPLKNISQIGSSSQLLGKNNKCSKPPTRVMLICTVLKTKQHRSQHRSRLVRPRAHEEVFCEHLGHLSSRELAAPAANKQKWLFSALVEGKIT